MLSAEAFISNIDAKALSIEETEFEKNMEFARALLSGLSTDLDGLSSQINQLAGQDQREPVESRHHTLKEDHANRPKSSDGKSSSKDQSSISKVPSISELENRGATILLKENQVSKVFQEYPYMFAHAGDLTVNDVEELLDNYKQLVFKYVCLLKGSDGATASFPLSKSQAQAQHHVETVKESQDHRAIAQNIGLQNDTGKEDGPNRTSNQEKTNSDLLKEEAVGSSEYSHDDTSEQ